MRRADKQDKKRVIDILAASFTGNKSVDYIVKQDAEKDKRIRALMDYSFERCRLFGEIWIAEDEKSCALVLYPHIKRRSLRAAWLDLRLVFQVVGWSRIKKILDREQKIKQKQPAVKMTYLWFIGVDPAAQGKGAGSALLHNIITASAKAGLPVHLQTSAEKNISWYVRRGFDVYDQLEIGYTIWFLKYVPA